MASFSPKFNLAVIIQQCAAPKTWPQLARRSGAAAKRNSMLTALHDDDALAADTTRAAIEHLRTARQLLKQTAALMQKSSSTSLPRKRIVQALKLAESALRTTRRSQTRLLP
jgi:hypothetical protein